MNEFLNITKKSAIDRRTMEEKAYDIIISSLYINDTKEAPLGEYNSVGRTMTTTYIPGNIYIFGYTADTKLQVAVDNIHTFEFYDKMPLILCTGYNKKYVSGINLNMCPCNVKTQVLNEIWNLDPDFYLNPNEENKFSVNTSKFFLDPKNPEKFKNYIITKYHIEDSFLIFRNYITEKIDKPKFVEYWAWKYIPFLTYKASIREATLKLIQANVLGKSKKTL